MQYGAKSEELSNNATVENFFKNVKMLYLEDEKNLKISRFIKKMFAALQLLLNSAKFNDLFKKRNRKRKNDFEPTDLNNGENWNKRKKSSTPTFPGKFINHIASPITSTTPIKMISNKVSKNLNTIFEENEISNEYREDDQINSSVVTSSTPIKTIGNNVSKILDITIEENEISNEESADDQISSSFVSSSTPIKTICNKVSGHSYSRKRDLKQRK